MIRAASIWLCAMAPSAVFGLDLQLPGNAVRTELATSDAGSGLIASGPWQNGTLETVEAEGRLKRSAWRIASSSRTTLQLFAPLRDQLIDAGYEIIFACKDRTCGGFDFRYSLNVLPEPAMHVDLGDFRYLAARRDTDDGPEFVSLLVSRSPGTGFVQITEVGAAVSPEAPVTASTKANPVTELVRTGQLESDIISLGHVVLEGLQFETGSSQLGSGSYQSLADLAGWLRSNPEARVTLVGHTDSEGSLAGNIALSKKRAASVRAHLINELGVSPGQLSADGIGFLSPRASNLTEDGRQKNRRVEAILTSTR